MRWSLRIGRIAGIGIYLHATFLLLPIWIGWSYFAVRREWSDALGGVLFAFVLFGIIVLHELGHALTARRFGIPTRDITLLPIGGVARLERMPEAPGQEFLVAIAGPAVNIVLAGLAFGALAGGHQLAGLMDVELVGGSFLVTFVWVNLALAVFNLVPAFPMDGGRVLRALLATRLSYVRATRIASTVGQVLAGLFILVGIMKPLPIWVLIGVFIYLGARQEAAMVELKAALGPATIGQLMITDFRSLTPQDPISKAAEYLMNGWQHDFPVIEGGRLVGMLNRDALVKGIRAGGTVVTVRDAMDGEFPVAGPEEPAHLGMTRLRGAGRRTLAVVEDGRLVGILTTENLGDYLVLRAALEREARTTQPQRAEAGCAPPRIEQPIPGPTGP